MNTTRQIQQRHLQKVRRIQEKRHAHGAPLATQAALRFLAVADRQDRSVDCTSLIKSGLRRRVKPAGIRYQEYQVVPVSTGTEAACGPVNRFANGNVFRRKPDSDEYYDVCLDAPFGFCLIYAGYPLAVAAFDFFADGFMECCQLQGTANIKFHCESGMARHALRQVDWSKILIHGALQWARPENLECRIRTGFDNPWTRVCYENGGPHLSLKHAVERYDVTALRLGFRLFHRRNPQIDITDRYVDNIKEWQRHPSAATPPYPPDAVWRKVGGGVTGSMAGTRSEKATKPGG